MTWQIVLHRRDGFTISKSEGERLVGELNQMYDLQGPACITFEDIRSGSVILTLRSSAEVFSAIESDLRTTAPKCSILDGMQLQKVRRIGYFADVVGSGVTFTRLCSCATTLKLKLWLPELFSPPGSSSQVGGGGWRWAEGAGQGGEVGCSSSRVEAGWAAALVGWRQAGEGRSGGRVDCKF